MIVERPLAPFHSSRMAKPSSPAFLPAFVDLSGDILLNLFPPLISTEFPDLFVAPCTCESNRVVPGIAWAGFPVSLVVGSPEKSSHRVKDESLFADSDCNPLPFQPENNAPVPPNLCDRLRTGMLLVCDGL